MRYQNNNFELVIKSYNILGYLLAKRNSNFTKIIQLLEANVSNLFDKVNSII